RVLALLPRRFVGRRSDPPPPVVAARSPEAATSLQGLACVPTARCRVGRGAADRGLRASQRGLSYQRTTPLAECARPSALGAASRAPAAVPSPATAVTVPVAPSP